MKRLRPKDLRALFISADGFEDSELTAPREHLEGEGVGCDVASIGKGVITGKQGHRVEATLSVQEVDPARYDLLVLPGGKAPARLRRDEGVLEVVRRFFAGGKPIAAICHGPQILIAAGLLKGRKATCYKSVAGEMRQAGVHYLDQDVVVDGNLITSRHPGDLPAFLREITRCLRL